jgi:hypothetical protein
MMVMINCGLNTYTSDQATNFVELAHSLEASSCSVTEFPEFYQIHGIYLHTEASTVKSISHTTWLLKHPGDIAGL